MQEKAFTLIECLIALSIVALLLTIAIPSYQHYRVRTHRVDAQTTLLKGAAAMEKYYYQHQTFATATIGSGNSKTDILDDAITEHNAYRISIHQQSNTSYTLWATPQGAQAQADQDCQIFTLNHLGKKGNQGSNDANQQTKHWRHCWG